MTPKIPGGIEGDNTKWNTHTPLKDVTHDSHPKSENKHNTQDLPSRLSSPKPEERTKKSASLKNRVKKEKKDLITESRLKKASDLFKISSVLTKTSQKTPLTPFNPGGGHANDVYISDFKSMDKSQENLDKTYKKNISDGENSDAVKPNPKQPVKFDLEDSEETGKPMELVKHEKPVSKTAEAIKANINNLDIVFKPGLAAAVRANICFGLTQLFDQFENVIAPTKKGEASVVSRQDFNTEREIVYNPESDCTYLINKKYMHHQVVVNVTVEDEDAIDGTVDGDDVLLTPVKGHPGFYKIEGLSLKTSKEVDKDFSENEDEISDDESSDDDVYANDIYVMHVSPSRIDQWANPDTEWKLIHINEEAYLVPQSQIKEVSDEKIGNNYEIAYLDEKKVLVPKSSCARYNEGRDNLNYDGKKFNVEIHEDDDSIFLLTPDYEVNSDPDEKTFVKVDRESWLQDQLIHQKNHVNYVTRNNMNYTIHEEADGLKVVGENISGMVQLKVENIFQKPKGSKNALDLARPSPNRDEFFKRIDMPSFIEAFLAVILLRPQDGKVVDLGESNILFQAMPNKEGKIDPQDSTCVLRPVIIDLDETMPAANDYTQDPEFVKHGEKTNIHAVRNGLMGFPQAAKTLTGEEKKLAVAYLKAILDNNDAVNQFLFGFLPKSEQKHIKEKKETVRENKENKHLIAKEKHISLEKQPGAFTEENINAYNAVVENLDLFLKENEKKDWSLQNLFFFVFPEYADQWEMLGNMEPVKKAMHIGADDPTKVRK